MLYVLAVYCQKIYIYIYFIMIIIIFIVHTFLEDIVASGYWQSLTFPIKAVACNRAQQYYYLPYWDTKQCMHIRSIWPDHRRRLYNSNLIAAIVDQFVSKMRSFT